MSLPVSQLNWCHYWDHGDVTLGSLYSTYYTHVSLLESTCLLTLNGCVFFFKSLSKSSTLWRGPKKIAASFCLAVTNWGHCCSLHSLYEDLYIKIEIYLLKFIPNQLLWINFIPQIQIYFWCWFCSALKVSISLKISPK